MAKDKIVYYRNQDNSEVVVINYTQLRYVKITKDGQKVYPMGSVTDRTENYLLYIGYLKSTQKKTEEILETFKD